MAKREQLPRVVIFDLDGTLTKSKRPLDRTMAKLLTRLLARATVAVIGGGSLSQFREQFLSRLNINNTLEKKLLLLPTSGGELYRMRGLAWEPLYRNRLSARQKRQIRTAFMRAFEELGYNSPRRIYGSVFEDRGNQITFSALGQEAPLVKKREWHRKHDVRKRLQKILAKALKDFEVRLGGLTSIDITRRGVDKAYGIQRVSELLRCKESHMMYVGDALYRGGNDEAVLRTNVITHKVSGPEETKRFIKKILRAKVSPLG